MRGGSHRPRLCSARSGRAPPCDYLDTNCPDSFLSSAQTHSEKWHHDSSSPFRPRSLCRTPTRRYSHSSPRKHQRHHGHITGLFHNNLIGSSWSSISLLSPHGAASRPGSRPDSRSGLHFPAVVSILTTPGFAAADVEGFGPGARSGSDPVSNQAGSPSSKVKELHQSSTPSKP